MTEKQIKRKLKTMDLILAVLLTVMILFIITMIWVYLRMGAVPDTLIVSVFAFFGLECGYMGWIKTTKTKLEDKLYGTGTGNVSSGAANLQRDYFADCGSIQENDWK